MVLVWFVNVEFEYQICYTTYICVIQSWYKQRNDLLNVMIYNVYVILCHFNTNSKIKHVCAICVLSVQLNQIRIISHEFKIHIDWELNI